MEVLFKDNVWIYYTEDGDLWIKKNPLYLNININLTNIPHLDDAKILYYYKDNRSGERFPVYFEYNNIFITKIEETEYSSYALFHVKGFYTKDNTLHNLNLL